MPGDRQQVLLSWIPSAFAIDCESDVRMSIDNCICENHPETDSVLCLCFHVRMHQVVLCAFLLKRMELLYGERNFYLYPWYATILEHNPHHFLASFSGGAQEPVFDFFFDGSADQIATLQKSDLHGSTMQLLRRVVVLLFHTLTMASCWFEGSSKAQKNIHTAKQAPVQHMISINGFEPIPCLPRSSISGCPFQYQVVQKRCNCEITDARPSIQELFVFVYRW